MSKCHIVGNHMSRLILNRLVIGTRGIQYVMSTGQEFELEKFLDFANIKLQFSSSLPKGYVH